MNSLIIGLTSIVFYFILNNIFFIHHYKVLSKDSEYIKWKD
jgi:hypothetical protein